MQEKNGNFLKNLFYLAFLPSKSRKRAKKKPAAWSRMFTFD